MTVAFATYHDVEVDEDTRAFRVRKTLEEAPVVKEGTAAEEAVFHGRSNTG